MADFLDWNDRCYNKRRMLAENDRYRAQMFIFIIKIAFSVVTDLAWKWTDLDSKLLEKISVVQ